MDKAFFERFEHAARQRYRDLKFTKQQVVLLWQRLYPHAHVFLWGPFKERITFAMRFEQGALGVEIDADAFVHDITYRRGVFDEIKRLIRISKESGPPEEFRIPSDKYW
jgi:hypothetical protein